MTTEVTSIFSQLNSAIDQNRYCLTIYRNMDNWSETVIQNELQNQLKALFKECNHGLEGIQIAELTKNVVDQVITLPFYKASVGIFLDVDLDNYDKAKISLGENLNIVFSEENISDSQSCGRIFALRNLFKMTKLFSDTLCVYVAKKETRFYLLNSEFKLLDKLDNVILEKYEDRFRNNTPGMGGVTHGGSAADEKEDKFNKTTLNEVVSRLKEIAQTQNKYKNMIVFLSSEFAGYESFIEPEMKYYTETPPLIIKKVIDKESNFEVEFKKASKEYFDKITREKLEKYQTSIDGQFKTDFTEIIECVRDARVQKIYIKEDFRAKGFVLTKDLPYLEKVDGANETEFLVDWIIRKVIQTGGEVFIIDKDSELFKENIVARLRY